MADNKLRREPGATFRKEHHMSRGATYLGLLATLRQEELLGEAARRQRATNVIRRRRGQTLASRIRRALRAPKR
jgi:hypothetical protein